MDLKEYFCEDPFERVEVNYLGEVHNCCVKWLPKPIGNLKEETMEEAWNSKAAQEIRKSIHDGSFRFCSPKHCHKLAGKTLRKKTDIQDPYLKDIIKNKQTILAKGAKRVKLTYDMSCNLSCPSCRTKTIILQGKEEAAVKEIHEKVIKGTEKDVEVYSVTGSGDPIGSPLFRKFLQTADSTTHPHIYYKLYTNGVLLNKNVWQSLEKIHTNISYIEISIDGATEETYKINRRGGAFMQLLKNIQMLGKEREKGYLKRLSLNCVVQQNNYKEMKDLIRLAKRLNCTSMKFKRIINWGTFSEEEFKKRDIFHPSHPEHEEFLALLKEDIFGSPFVELGNIQPFRAKNTQKYLRLEMYSRNKEEKTHAYFALDDKDITMRFCNLLEKIPKEEALVRYIGWGMDVDQRNLEYGIKTLNTHIDKFNKLNKNGFSIPFSFTKENISQETLNQAHECFEAFHQIYGKSNPFNNEENQRPYEGKLKETKEERRAIRLHLNAINCGIHDLENIIKTEPSWARNNSAYGYLSCTLTEKQKDNLMEPLKEEDYSLFSLESNFGDLCLNYATTGKNLHHIYENNDIELLKKGYHAAPQQVISSGIMAFFSTYRKDHKEEMKKFNEWWDKENISQYGYIKNDPKNSIGYIKIGQLVKSKDIEQFYCDCCDHIKEFDIVAHYSNFPNITKMEIVTQIT